MRRHTLALGLMAAPGIQHHRPCRRCGPKHSCVQIPHVRLLRRLDRPSGRKWFDVTATNSDDMGRIKAEAGLIPGLGSCHTAFVDGYVIEGHVPADDIKRLLAEAPRPPA